MQYIPGSSVTLSASLSYLAKNLPDDSDVQTNLPQICVDYLSHEWLEEDVWKSWRNMTRHKNEVTNGVRLENASWRTWWKQRNKLKTVSPETLNWLKDSDVTWLYGPLHTAAQPVPPPKQSTTEERFNLVNASGKKPILKHRTISELLNIPAHDSPSVIPQAIGSPALEAVRMDLPSSGSREGSPRPTLPHTKSDSHIVRRASNSSGRASPPRVTVMGDDHDDISRSMSPANSEGLAGSTSNLNKRHISFNTFVEQCISIDDPAQARSAYDDSDGGVMEEDDEEEEDDSSLSSVLEMNRRPTERTPGGPVVRSNSTSQERERMTIAPIPPTSLKTSGDFPAPSPQVVYAPPKEFMWELPGAELSSSDSVSSSDNLSNASGSITGGPVDLGFVAPQWGRAPAAPGSVGSGSTGPVGPSDLFQANVYEAVGYEEPHRPPLATSPPSKGIGYGAGRSKWVSGAPTDDDEEDEDEEDEAADNSSDALSESEEPEETHDKKTSPPTVISNSSSSTTSDAATVIAARSPPSSVRSGSSRGSSQPSKSILKNSVHGAGAHPSGNEGPSGAATTTTHSNPIGIPKPSISHPPPPPPPASTNNGYSQLPPTATISAPSGPSVGFLSPTQHEVLFFGSPKGGEALVAGPPSGGRGRTSTRSASSSGISDRSRSSSKISGTSSPLGSVSPSGGHGSPSSSRASSVLGNRRSSTDVGVNIGRSAAAGVGAGGRSNSLRQASTSPPAVSSPLVNSTTVTIASSLGTIVANVPLDTASAVSSNGNGPPVSRSGRSNSTLGIGAPRVSSSRPRLGPRTHSASSVSSSGSSGSTSTAGAPRTPKDNVSIVLPPEPLPVQAVAAANKKPSVALPVGEPRPHVIISPQASIPPPNSTSAASSAGASPSGGTTMSLEARDLKLEEAMRKARAAAAASDPDDDVSDAGETDVGTFVEQAKSNPTPSNSPVLGFAKVLSNRDTTPTKKSPSSLAVSSPPLAASPRPKSTPTDPVVTPTSASAPTDEGGTVMGKAADTLASSAKGLLGAIWGMGGDSSSTSATPVATSASR